MPQIISQLLNPANSIVVQFDQFGGVSVIRYQKKGSGYVVIESASLKTISFDQLDFEFSIDGNGNAKPDAGMVVETDGYWPADWCRERGTVLGGTIFPFGNEAIQAGTDSNGSIKPGRKFAGFFKNSSAGWQVTHVDLVHTAVDTLTGDPEGVPTMYVALWLPTGVSGQVTFPKWSDAGGKTVRYQAPQKTAAKGGKGGKNGKSSR